MSVATALDRGGSRVDRARQQELSIAAGQVQAVAATLGVCVLVILVPFETSHALLQLPGQSFSSAEAVVVAALCVWGASLVVSGQVPARRSALTVPAVLFLLAAMAAAAFSPVDRVNALHMSGRLVFAFAVFLLAFNAVSSRHALRALALAAMTAGVVVSALAIMEFAAQPSVLRFLELFRPGVATVGSQIRASGPFQYPTIASMYLEVLFAIGLGLLVTAVDGRSWLLASAGAVALALTAEAIVLTFTRAGLITMAASLLIVGAWRYGRFGWDRGVSATLAIALVVAAELFASRSLDAFALRLTTETQDEWYRSTLDAPAQLSLQTGATVTVPVTITNTGRVPWDPNAVQPFRLSYHWMHETDDTVVVWEGVRTTFDRPVQPGETRRVMARVRAPAHPGTFRLLWDVEQQHHLWFSSEPFNDLVFSRAVVSGAVAGADVTPVPTLPKKRARPGRLVLWGAALRMFAAHPLLGVGPDNFRLTYGSYAGVGDPDPRVHSNNMYLEVLAGMGVVGVVAALWCGWRTVQSAWQTVTTGSVLAVSLVAALVAIAAHGLVDSFLSFTATYVLMAIVLGLVVGVAAGEDMHARRV